LPYRKHRECEDVLTFIAIEPQKHPFTKREKTKRDKSAMLALMMKTLPHITIETAPDPDSAIIWLHGLGADGHDFEPIVPQLGLSPNARIRFIFPHAPAMPVTINGGYVMPAWYDIHQTDLGIQHDEAGIAVSTRSIQMLIDQQQMHGIQTSRIVLAGFSQGAAMALHVGLAQGEALGGVMALSGYLLLPNQIETHVCPEALNTPLFMAHGINDPVVPFGLGEAAHDKLQKLGLNIEWHSYPMQHQVCTKEVTAIGAWLNKIL